MTEFTIPDALPIDPSMSVARRYAALAGIGQDDPLLCEILSNPGTSASERRAVVKLVWVRLKDIPGAYEAWRERVRND